MNKNMNATTTDTITIPVEAFEHMFVIMGALSQMHLRLINLYEIESDLKKRHKAYLHIREQAEEICKEDRKTVFAMIESLNPKNFPKVESAMSAVSQPKNAFDSEQCVGCASVDACAAHDDKQDAGRTDNATVLMSTDTLGQMQEDMINLCDLIDRFMDLFACLLSGRPVSEEDLCAVMHEAVDLTDEVIERCDEADMVTVL